MSAHPADIHSTDCKPRLVQHLRDCPIALHALNADLGWGHRRIYRHPDDFVATNALPLMGCDFRRRHVGDSITDNRQLSIDDVIHCASPNKSAEVMLARAIFTVTFFQTRDRCGRMHLTAVFCFVFQIEEKKQRGEKSLSFFHARHCACKLSHLCKRRRHWLQLSLSLRGAGRHRGLRGDGGELRDFSQFALQRCNSAAELIVIDLHEGTCRLVGEFRQH